MKPTLLPPPAGRLAAFTLDVEHDYGSRIGSFRAFEDRAGLDALTGWLRREQVPLSAFCVTSLLQQTPALAAWLREAGAELHSHTHAHPRGRAYDADAELGKSLEVLRGEFGCGAVGYRAPHGLISPAQLDAARRLGYRFSSSVFPAWRPGHFNHRDLPLMPFQHANGVLELPFAVVRGLRLVVAISYFKLIGWNVSRALMSVFGLPSVLVIDSHFHDLLLTPSYHQLPAGARLAWGIRRARGVDYAGRLVAYLRRRGYRFVTMNALAAAANGSSA